MATHAKRVKQVIGDLFDARPTPEPAVIEVATLYDGGAPTSIRRDIGYVQDGRLELNENDEDCDGAPAPCVRLLLKTGRIAFRQPLNVGVQPLADLDAVICDLSLRGGGCIPLVVGEITVIETSPGCGDGGCGRLDASLQMPPKRVGVGGHGAVEATGHARLLHRESIVSSCVKKPIEPTPVMSSGGCSCGRGCGAGGGMNPMR